MKRNLLRIGLVLLVIFLLPASTLTLYELSSLNRNERMLEEVYTKQLEVILFSVNQYSQDVTNGWVGKLGNILREKEPLRSKGLEAFLEESVPIRGLVVADSLGDPEIEVFGESAWAQASDIGPYLQTQKEKISRLRTYLRGGYQKIEPLEELPLLLFLSETQEEQSVICALLIDPQEFIEQVLAPRLQAVGGDKAVLTVFRQDTTMMYSTEETDPTAVQQKLPLWLLPDYSLGIVLKGPSLSGLVQRRSYTNLILILGMNVIVLLGVWWVFRNLRRELDLAQAKSDFVSNVSHEIRTPLALISMFAETLEMGRVRSEEKKQEYYHIISQETRRLASIVNKILNFSKMEAGKRSFQMAPTDLNAVASEVLRSYDFHLTQNGFSYHFQPAENLPSISGDTEAVSEALINLIDNAVKYSEDKKEILLRSGQEEGWVYLEVEDKGMGIPLDQQQAIFEKFYRVASGPVHNTKGTGLGLSLVQHIMDAHGGKVTVRSEEGEGSCFRLSFPGREE